MRPLNQAALAVLVAASAALLGSCTTQTRQPLSLAVPRGLELYAPIPEDNPPTNERVALGARLFVDPALSVDRTVACASCHKPGHAFADSVPFSRGASGKFARRNTPTLLNVAYARHLTWDGRSSTLEEQVLKPIQDPDEMGLSLDELVVRLSAESEYREAFRDAFDEPITSEGVARAIASYLRTLRSGDAPLDRFNGGDATALPSLERAGFQLFVGKARCSFCHAGPTLTDGQFHNTGVSARSGSSDVGRYARTGTDSDRGAFRTPTLRNVTLTAPYMHDGSLATLRDVIEFYDGGGEPNPDIDPDIRPLRLTAAEKEALLAFLGALSGR